MGFLLCTAMVLNCIGMFFELFFLGMSLIMSVIYYWSRVHPQAQGEVSFMFGLKFEGIYLPWVLVAFTVLMGGDPKPDLAGIAAAHLFYFLKDVYPAEHAGQKLISTPQFIRGIFSNAVRDPTQMHSVDIDGAVGKGWASNSWPSRSPCPEC